jgi:hypothetical protein
MDGGADPLFLQLLLRPGPARVWKWVVDVSGGDWRD